MKTCAICSRKSLLPFCHVCTAFDKKFFGFPFDSAEERAEYISEMEDHDRRRLAREMKYSIERKTTIYASASKTYMPQY